MTQATTRHFVTAAIVQAAPGFRELRISIREQGQADDVALIAVRPMHDTADVLAAFGWRLVRPLEYVAGPNEERGRVEPCTPAATSAAECMRNAVRREIRARTLARLAHPTARHFHPVLLNGDHSRDPIGWTFRVGQGGDRTYAWVTAAGHICPGAGVPSVVDAKRNLRHEYMAAMLEEHPPADALPLDQFHPGDVLARTLLIVRNGGTPDLAEHQAPTDEEQQVPAFKRGDKVVCADGVTRTVEGMASAVSGEPARVVVEGGEWIAENCQRANREDVLDAHRRCNAAATRVRTELDPSNPEWRAALDELTGTLAFLRQADPIVRVALDEDDARAAAQCVHPDACGFQPLYNPGEDEPVAWTFRVSHGAASRYGVVTRNAEVSPIGLYEYPTTAERAYRQHESALTR
ncbi:hypothetical protein ACFV27_00775 [Streptomyces antimycoticus]|uniref:hypothetical protein n=1 Tax=Streptomyces antimycoticus TaxID=68175 RepID=UPI0036C918AF